MSQSVQLIGIPHQLQGPKFNGYVEDSSYSDWVEGFIRRVDFVFEEAAGRRPSVAEQHADSILKPGHYMDIDPPVSERHKYGLAEESATGGPIDPCHSSDAYESPYVGEQIKREELWQKRIQAQKFDKGLVICGIAHSLSVAFRLQGVGMSVEVYTYIPHGKLCSRQHVATGSWRT
jgi:hypothetical protein